MKQIIRLTFFSLLATTLSHPMCSAEPLPADTLKVMEIGEVVVTSSPKENLGLRELPQSSNQLTQQDMKANHVRSVKSLTGIVPNLFIPDYGSQLTTSIYIRGIGSRINTPAVGLYLNDLPCIDKSSFDFSYADVERIDVLRGAQSTLYGRNTMAGLIKVYTKSPFAYQGTDLRAEAGSYGEYRTSLTHYHRLSPHFAFSAGGFYEHTKGFFHNAARHNQHIDRSDAGGGHLRAIFIPHSRLKLDATLRYEQSHQGGYPYQYTGVIEGEETRSEYIGRIAYNEPSTYRRSLLHSGISLEYQADDFILSSATGYQHLHDRMRMDQDFTELDIYTLMQKQRSHILSEELVLKSKPGRRWQWTTGLFTFYQWLHTNAPVQFRSQGVKTLIEDNVNQIFDGLTGAPPMQLNVNNQLLNIGGCFNTPTWNAAVFHQSTLNHFAGIEGLSLTLGLRLDYEKMKMDYRSASDPLDFDFSVMSLRAEHLQASSLFDGEESSDYVQLLPKFSLQYEWQPRNNVYFTLARGYRSGGYNIQLFSDLAQGALKNSMLDALASNPTFSMMGNYIQQLKEALPKVADVTRYRPEYTWNYELGTHLTLLDENLWADVAVFYMDTRDQQVTRFSESGLGRTTTNAGKSHSYGMELSLRSQLTDALNLNLSYGYTHATFTDYIIHMEQADGSLSEQVNYNGQRVPFVPEHTLHVGGEYAFHLQPNQFLRRIVLQANYNAAGRIYWTEDNRVCQPFYGTLNGQINFENPHITFSLWARNLLDEKYAAFYFESMNRGFMQEGRQFQWGVSVRCSI